MKTADRLRVFFILTWNKKPNEIFKYLYSPTQRWAKWKTHDGCGYFRWQKFLPSIDIAHSINFRNAIEKFWVPIKNAIQCHPNAIETLFDESLVRVQ